MYHDQDDTYNHEYRMHGLWIDATEWAVRNGLNPRRTDIVERYQKILLNGKAKRLASH